MVFLENGERIFSKHWRTSHLRVKRIKWNCDEQVKKKQFHFITESKHRKPLSFNRLKECYLSKYRQHKQIQNHAEHYVPQDNYWLGCYGTEHCLSKIKWNCRYLFIIFSPWDYHSCTIILSIPTTETTQLLMKNNRRNIMNRIGLLWVLRVRQQ